MQHAAEQSSIHVTWTSPLLDFSMELFVSGPLYTTSLARLPQLAH
jgi:hypothetical protein